MALLPSVITHTYDPARGPFRNILTLAYDEAERILEDIRQTGHRKYKPDYLQRRIATEEWLYTERTRKLGKPQLKHPVYFFLGEFSETDPARPASIRVPLIEFSRQAITFTFPDSMASLPLATLTEHQQECQPYHGQVFTLDEIERVVSKYGMPESAPESAIDGAKSRYDTFIEAQIWDENPLRKYCPLSSQTF